MRDLCKRGCSILQVTTISFLLFSCTSLQSTTFTARGCCPTCETAILLALETDGVKSATWNQFEEKITVKYDSKKLSPELLQKIVADAGYDTDLYLATDSVYLSMPNCCRYRD